MLRPPERRVKKKGGEKQELSGRGGALWGGGKGNCSSGLRGRQSVQLERKDEPARVRHPPSRRKLGMENPPAKVKANTHEV